MSRNHRELLNRQPLPMVDVIQIGSDGAASFYQVKVDEAPEAEIFMAFSPGHTTADLWVKRYGEEIARIRIQTVGINWIRDAHNSVANLLRAYWPDAIVRFWTRGQLSNAEYA